MLHFQLSWFLKLSIGKMLQSRETFVFPGIPQPFRTFQSGIALSLNVRVKCLCCGASMYSVYSACSKIQYEILIGFSYPTSYPTKLWLITERVQKNHTKQTFKTKGRLTHCSPMYDCCIKRSRKSWANPVRPLLIMQQIKPYSLPCVSPFPFYACRGRKRRRAYGAAYYGATSYVVGYNGKLE